MVYRLDCNSVPAPNSHTPTANRIQLSTEGNFATCIGYMLQALDPNIPSATLLTHTLPGRNSCSFLHLVICLVMTSSLLQIGTWASQVARALKPDPGQWLSKCGLWMGSISHTREPVPNANSWPRPRPPASETPGWGPALQCSKLSR